MDENFEGAVGALINSLENYVSTKTIVGEPIQYKDIVIFPMADVSFGVAAGAFNKDSKNNKTGGAGAKITPSAVLIIQNGSSKVVNIKDKYSINKLIEIIPDFLNKLFDHAKSKSKPESDTPRIEDYL